MTDNKMDFKIELDNGMEFYISGTILEAVKICQNYRQLGQGRLLYNNKVRFDWI